MALQIDGFAELLGEDPGTETQGGENILPSSGGLPGKIFLS
ncbi:MAG: hypothetical protein ABSF14_08470 [Terriglobia bacterium]|jgi:hypothetical protein